MTDQMWELLEPAAHSNPAAPLSVDEAHRLMRVHRDCALDSCGSKRTAFRYLVAAGRIVPDSSRRH
ncbi:hypothetical protein [Nocardia sp. NPDC048505]|uniref:hypothetical protein n=1 Tax=unclassified Nocardia TaxID=2637762 RepID=UPI003402E1E7